MKNAVLAMLLTLTFNLSAKELTLNCDFTEPFISIKLITDTNNIGDAGDSVLLSVIGEKLVKTKTTSNTIQSDDFTFNFSFKNNADLDFILNVDLKKSGNNGMSDDVYTAEAILTNSYGLKVYGGCNIL